MIEILHWLSGRLSYESTLMIRMLDFLRLNDQELDKLTRIYENSEFLMIQKENLLNSCCQAEKRVLNAQV